MDELVNKYIINKYVMKSQPNRSENSKAYKIQKNNHLIILIQIFTLCDRVSGTLNVSSSGPKPLLASSLSIDELSRALT